MSRKRHSTDQIIGKLRQADVGLGQGKSVEEACRALKITVQTGYRWRQKCGGMQPAMARQLKALRKENSRLKKVVVDRVLNVEILREGTSGKLVGLDGKPIVSGSADNTVKLWDSSSLATSK